MEPAAPLARDPKLLAPRGCRELEGHLRPALRRPQSCDRRTIRVGLLARPRPVQSPQDSRKSSLTPPPSHILASAKRPTADIPAPLRLLCLAVFSLCRCGPFQAKTYFPDDVYAELEDALLTYGQQKLGCSAITPIWLSCYIDGCYQVSELCGLPADATHSPSIRPVATSPSE